MDLRHATGSSAENRSLARRCAINAMADAEEKLFDAARRGQAICTPPMPEGAAVAGCANVIAVLLDYRASVDGCSRSGQLAAGERGCAPRQTALHFAAREGREAALASGGCALLIRQEACRRIKVVEDDIECLQDRLTRAVAAKELLELQLSEPVAPSHASAWLGRAVWGAERTWGG
ncbi:unnamed protein product [Cladocopium goreaui]|uniref:Uncharacterized protein n=1 Tax=Cladocopium goreaui TaxID=2562237 RepID=A0A9P1CAG3_9DINO|nr:unnamed protein product [Cladocopium goreaui]